MTNHEFEYRFRAPLCAPEERNGQPPKYEKRIEAEVFVEKDVAIALRDGVTIYADIYRPLDENPAPPIIAWGPYGKHGHTRYSHNFPAADVDDSNLSRYTAFEAPDALFWVPQGYVVINVDPRGTWHSQGRATYLSPEEALDFYDVIEWAGTQSWSSGKVGLSGVSYLTSSQWRVAELNPPHLAAINPWEGWTDTYREVVRHGGIPETSFWSYLPGRWGASVTEVEDIARETAERPFYDDYWKSKTCDFGKITCPAFVVASWTDQALHTRGTLEGYKRISSEKKWLYVHGRKKWAQYYDPEAMTLQKTFFDHVLKGEQNEVLDWPKARLEMRERFYVGDIREEADYPVPGTEHRRLFLDAGTAMLTDSAPETPGRVTYLADRNPADPDHASFLCVFDETTDLCGPMKLKLWVSAEETDDMDLFVAIQKLDGNGDIVPFAYYAQFENGPVALGWMRVSRRALDPELSTPDQPVQAHVSDQKVPPGEIVSVEIEIWPSGTRFHAGEGLRVVVQGEDVYDYEAKVYARHHNLMNRGSHTIHTGGEHDSHLLIPVLPA